MPTSFSKSLLTVPGTLMPICSLLHLMASPDFSSSSVGNFLLYSATSAMFTLAILALMVASNCENKFFCTCPNCATSFAAIEICSIAHCGVSSGSKHVKTCVTISPLPDGNT